MRGVGLSDSEGEDIADGDDDSDEEDGEDDDESNGHDEPLPQARGRSINKYGESRASAKVLNLGGEEGPRLSKMAEVDRQHAESAQASAAHQRARTGMLRPVIQTLVSAGVVAEDYNKQPTIPIMTAFINNPQHPERTLAFQKYKRAWGLHGGKTVGWEYFFDFIHGGHVGHETVMAEEGVPPKALVTTYTSMTKKDGQAKKTNAPATGPALGL